MAASAYCTNSEVQEEWKDLTFGSGTSVSATRVDRFIEEASAYIEGKIGLVYVTPITQVSNPKSFLILKGICIEIVARRLRPILNVRAPAAKDSQESSKASDENSPYDMLNDIVAGKILLSDASKRSSSDGVNSFTRTNGIENTFKKGRNQW